MSKKEKQIILFTLMILVVVGLITIGILLMLGVFPNASKFLGVLPISFVFGLINQIISITKSVIHYKKVKEQVGFLTKHKKSLEVKKNEPPKRTKNSKYY